MTRKQLIEKYRDNAIMSMFNASGDDEGVCLDKLIYTAQNLGNPDADVYPGIPTDFDFDTFLVEIKDLFKEQV